MVVMGLANGRHAGHLGYIIEKQLFSRAKLLVCRISHTHTHTHTHTRLQGTQDKAKGTLGTRDEVDRARGT